jgi:hypothetical protein
MIIILFMLPETLYKERAKRKLLLEPHQSLTRVL